MASDDVHPLRLGRRLAGVAPHRPARRTRVKPSAAKGRYVRTVHLSTSMGPSIAVDPTRTRNLLAIDA